MKSIINPKANFIFAIYIAIMPISISIFDIFGINFNISYQMIFWGVGYFLFSTFCLVKFLLNGGKLKVDTRKKCFIILAVLMVTWMILTCLINKSFNLFFILYLTLLLIFLCFLKLEKRHISIIVNALLIVMAISCVMGFIDPRGKFMPGFNSGWLPLSLQFVNPNYAACVVSVLTILCFILFDRAKRRLNILYGAIYFVFATYLFMNGSFAPISSVFIVEISILIFVWVRHKKCNYRMLGLIIGLIPICFLVDLIPNISVLRTCKYNYFLEGIAVFDNIFNTNILSLFGIDRIQGADGWDRNSLMLNSLKHSVSSVKTFVFGSGAGCFNKLRPHNTLISLLLDFGVVMPILYITFFVMLFTHVIKMRFNFNRFYLAMMIVAFLLSSIVSSLIFYSYYICIINLAFLLKNIFEPEQLKPFDDI